MDQPGLEASSKSKVAEEGGAGAGGGDEGGGGSACLTWQTYGLPRLQSRSFHCPDEPPTVTQSSPVPQLFGSPGAQFRYADGDPSDHTHVPSFATSLSPIHASLPLVITLTSACSDAEWMMARSPPRATQSARA